jgi:HPt (histidine-containing phosphotransfer) domain-containing protein
MVAMTANIMVDDRALYKRNHMPDYVGKPFTSQELWRCLMKYFTPVRWQSGDEARRKQDDEKLWRKLVVNFVTSNQARFGEIVKALEEGDIKLAYRLAHTLKGNAGQLGKSGLRRAAGDVESLLAEGKNLVTPAHMHVLESELRAVLEEFAPFVDEPAPARPAAPAGPLDAEEARELLEKLGAMLEDGDPECLTLVDNLRLVPGSEKLIQQMDALDFEPARATLAALKEKQNLLGGGENREN